MTPMRISKLTERPTEFGGVRVITASQVDDIHGRDRGQAAHAVRRLRRRRYRDTGEPLLTEGRHFFSVPYRAWSQWDNEAVSDTASGRGGRKGPLVVLTERGYAAVAKTFDDDAAWRIHEEMVEVYFRARDVAAQADRFRRVTEEREALERHERQMLETLISAAGRILFEQRKRKKLIADDKRLGQVVFAFVPIQGEEPARAP